MENHVLLAFCLILFLSILFQVPLLGALFLGFLLFAGYALRQGSSLSQILAMAWKGVQGVRTIFLVFLLIGMLTGVWRSSGTIPYLVTLSAHFIHPAFFLLLGFLSNCLISFLLGSSFATAATMGVITMKIGLSLGIPPLYTGGTILSGVYFGDRMSPVSTSAMLISVLTDTDIYQNIRNMARSSLVPFLCTCAVYLLLGFQAAPGTLPAEDGLHSLAALFTFSPWLLLPALSILLCSFLRIPIRYNMLISICLAALLTLLIQGMSFGEMMRTMLLGYRSPQPELGPMINGGGMVSMLRVGAIVCVSASYAGIFEGTGLLDGLKERFLDLARLWGNTPAITLAALFTSLIACNQTFSTILTHQLCRKFNLSPEKLALALEDTTVVLSPLVPWSIACAVVLDSTGSPKSSVFLACYLYLIPLWGLGRARRGK